MVFGFFRPRDHLDHRSKPGSHTSRFHFDTHSLRLPNGGKSSALAGTGSVPGGSVHSDGSSSTAVMSPLPVSQYNQTQRPYGRRERNLIDVPCAFCEEPLQHTLVGERVLHFTCSHVAHEECLYEIVRETEAAVCPVCNIALSLDVTRGGTALDIEKLASAVRSTQASSIASSQAPTNLDSRWNGRGNESAVTTPTPDKSFTARSQSSSKNDSADTDSRMNPGYHNYPTRNVSNAAASYSDYAEVQPQTQTANRQFQIPSAPRTHRDSIDSAGPINPARNSIKQPIPPPEVTIRTEFPTITRLPVAQSITCIVSVVVPYDWKISLEDYLTSSVAPSTSTSSPPIQPSNTASMQSFPDNNAFASKSPTLNAAERRPSPSSDELEKAAEILHNRVEHWHNLDFGRFGKLMLYGQIRVGKDSVTWQDLDCYLFSQMLICVKDKKPLLPTDNNWDPDKRVKSTLKGSILIQKHLQSVEVTHHGPEPILTLSLSVPALPAFYLKFSSMGQLLQWQRALVRTCNLEPPPGLDTELDQSGTDEDDSRLFTNTRRVSSINSSACAKSYTTAPTAYSVGQPTPGVDHRPLTSLHVPMDIIVVVPVSSSMQGLKISLLRDTLRFIVSTLGDRDRIGLVTFGSSNGSEPLVGLSSKSWHGWQKIFDGLRPVGQKNLRADVVEGTNVAMNLLMQRRVSNPIAAILLISDSSSADQDGIDFVVSRAEAARVGVHSFGLGLSHKPDTMIELSTRTKAPYTYVKDWMMLRESVAGCLGWIQSTSHQNAKLRLRIPEGSPIKFVKISGALQVLKRASGRDAEACLGDLALGSRRDILVQLSVLPETPVEQNMMAQDPWESLVSGLEALGGSGSNSDTEDYSRRHLSVDELPLLQADLIFGDILLGGSVATLPRPTLLTVPLIPSSGGSISPMIPPNMAVVQRRMELLTSDMLARALSLVSRGQHDRAHHLLTQTRMIITGLGNGNLPSLSTPSILAPPTQIGGQATPGGSGMGYSFPSHPNSQQQLPSQPQMPGRNGTIHHQQSSPRISIVSNNSNPQMSNSPATTPTIQIAPINTFAPDPLTSTAIVDPNVMSSLDAELTAALEWILHPAVFGRDSRKAVLQSIGVISSQRSYTFHSKMEQMWAGRVNFVKSCVDSSRGWREEDEGIREEM